MASRNHPLQSDAKRTDFISERRLSCNVSGGIFQSPELSIALSNRCRVMVVIYTNKCITLLKLTWNDLFSGSWREKMPFKFTNFRS